MFRLHFRTASGVSSSTSSLSLRSRRALTSSNRALAPEREVLFSYLSKRKVPKRRRTGCSSVAKARDDLSDSEEVLNGTRRGPTVRPRATKDTRGLALRVPSTNSKNPQNEPNSDPATKIRYLILVAGLPQQETRFPNFSSPVSAARCTRGTSVAKAKDGRERPHGGLKPDPPGTDSAVN